jgi:hypothetical protein
VKRGEPISIKIPVKCSEEQLDLIDKWKRSRLLSTKFFEKVDEELTSINEIQLSIGRQLTEDELKRLNSPGIKEMLGNMCLALLSNQVPVIPTTSQPVSQQVIKHDELQKNFNSDINDPSVTEAIDALIDDDDWD